MCSIMRVGIASGDRIAARAVRPAVSSGISVNDLALSSRRVASARTPLPQEGWLMAWFRCPCGHVAQVTLRDGYEITSVFHLHARARVAGERRLKSGNVGRCWNLLHAHRFAPAGAR